MTARALDLEPAHRAAGAVFSTDLGHRLPAHYGDAGREQDLVRRGAGLFDRSYRGFLDVSGPESGAFLDRILSSPVSRLAPGKGQPSAILTAKGRLIAAFSLHSLSGGGFRLATAEPLRDELIQGLQKYALLSDVELRDRSGELGVLSLEGPGAARVLSVALAGADVPAEELGSSCGRLGTGEVTVVRAGETPERGFDVWVPRPDLPGAWDALLAAVREVGGGPAGHEAAEALRIEAGLPRHGKDYSEENFPAEVALERALTYDKCYVGQEIVARMKTYGHANRRLEGVIVRGPHTPPSGARVLVGAEEAGTVTSSAASSRLGCAIALAMVRRPFWEVREGGLESPRGEVEVELRELPIVRLDDRGAS